MENVNKFFEVEKMQNLDNFTCSRDAFGACDQSTYMPKQEMVSQCYVNECASPRYVLEDLPTQRNKEYQTLEWISFEDLLPIENQRIKVKSERRWNAVATSKKGENNYSKIKVKATKEWFGEGTYVNGQFVPVGWYADGTFKNDRSSSKKMKRLGNPTHWKMS
jgi:hypothetical protein